MLMLRSLVVCMLLWTVASGTLTLTPDPSWPAQLHDQFGCALASSTSTLGVFATSSSQDTNSAAWGLFPFQQTSNHAWTSQQILSAPLPSTSRPTLYGTQCFVDMYNNYAVIGEPWWGEHSGRVLLVKSASAGNSWGDATVLATGKQAMDEFGSDVAISGEWLVASAPRANEPYIMIFRSDGQSYVKHSELTRDDVPGFDVRNTAFGAWIDLRSQWMVIGSPSEYYVGKAFVFKYVDSAHKWELFQSLETPSRVGNSQDTKSFGSSVALRTNRLFVSAPGSSASHGTVFEYAFNAHDEWSLVAVLKSPDLAPGDDFGRAIAATESTLAISEGPVEGRAYPRVHTYQQCGTHKLALRTAVLPDEAERSNGRWGRRLSWNGNALAIGSSGSVSIWYPAGPSHCSTALGPFPTPSCCYDGANIIVSPSGVYDGAGKTTITGDETTTATWIDTPIRVEGDLEISGATVLAMKKTASLQVAGVLTILGSKLKIQLVRPADAVDGKAESFNLDNFISYDSKVSSFSDITAEFETTSGSSVTHCDKFTVRPYYNPQSIGFIIDVVFQSNNCKAASGNPLMAVYVTLGVLAILIVTVILAIWNVPALRALVFRPRQAHSGYTHARLLGTDEEDDEDSQTHHFQSFPADYDMTLGAESDSEEEDSNRSKRDPDQEATV